METRANYLIVGVFMLALVLGAFGFAMWVAKSSLEDINVYYYIYFKGSVSGLQNGSQVLLRGVPVGNVSDISIDTGNVELIQVTVGLKPGTPIKTDTVAQLQAQGITGLSVIYLSGGTQNAPPLEPRLGKRRAVIPSVRSSLERVFENVPEVTAALAELTARGNELLSDQNLKAISNVFAHLDVLTAALAQNPEDLTNAIHGAAELTGDLRRLAAQLGQTAERLTGRSEEVAARISRTADSVTKLADEVHAIAADNRGPLRDFGQNGLYELTLFLGDARVMVNNLNRLIAQIERDPARFFFGDQQKGVEAK